MTPPKYDDDSNVFLKIRAVGNNIEFVRVVRRDRLFEAGVTLALPKENVSAIATWDPKKGLAEWVASVIETLDSTFVKLEEAMVAVS